jgi:hypothetical protein
MGQLAGAGAGTGVTALGGDAMGVTVRGPGRNRLRIMAWASRFRYKWLAGEEDIPDPMAG